MERIKCWVGRRNAAAVAVEESRFQQLSLNSGAVTPSTYRPPPLVTSSTFDNDEKFMAVAKAMLFRYENEGMTKREAIDATLVTHEEKRAFLESLDLRTTQFFLEQQHPSSEECIEESSLAFVIQKATVIFGDDLRAAWREYVHDENDNSSSKRELMSQYVSSGEYNFIKPPPSPRNHGDQQQTPKISSSSTAAPLTTTNKTTSRTTSALPLSNSNSTNSPYRSNLSTGRRRRRFFADCDSHRCRSRIRFDFKLATTISSATAATFGTTEPVQSLQLDGMPSAPPPPSSCSTSPLPSSSNSSSSLVSPPPSKLGYQPPSPMESSVLRLLRH